MKRVLVITNNLKQASYRVRIEKLIPLLAASGIELDVKVRPRGWPIGSLARQKLFQSAKNYDSVILQRKLLDGAEARLLARSARRVIFDVDDAVMYCQGNAGFWERRRARRRFEQTARAVSHVVAGNEYLADLFRREGAEVSVLPSVVDVKQYAVKEHAATKTPTLVWIGSRSTLPYVEEFLPKLEAAAGLVEALKLLIVADQTLPSLGKLTIEHIPWTEAGETEALLRGDIGIAPTPRNVWTEGKCGFKIIQYMAAGLPVIASPVGANAELVVDRETGFLPAAAADWPAAIANLALPTPLRSRMGAAGRRRAEAQYSLERAVDFWVRLLSE